jgi:outer membrane biosynthesis protein TonB
MSDFFKDKRRGIIGTAIFHVILLALLIFLGFHTPLPLPGEEGILVNFGYEETGSGEVEPSKPSTPVKPVEEKTTPPPVEQTQSPAPEEAKEEVLTQDFEKTVAVESKKETKPKEKTKEEIEAERIRQQEIERKRQEELERKQKEEEERKAKEEEQRKIEEIKSQFKNSFGQGKSDSENKSTGEGEGTYKGNQGKEHGSVDSDIHGDVKGLGTEGISFSLKGRSSKILPKPDDTSQKEGIVVVEIRVNSNGDVISANPGVKGSTTLDEYLCDVAKKAALKAKFSAKPNAPDQIGSITYHFVLE